jgi:PAS domain S-box-containing protein
VVAPIETDRNLLFGVLALQADLIDSRQFIDACTLWTTRKSVPLANVLMENGWLEPADKSHVEYLVERKLQKHGGDAKASLALAPDEIKRSLAALGDVDIHRSLTDLPRPDGAATTVSYIPEKRLRYRLDQLHATGGLGRIWLAHDSEFGRDVALKELRPEQSDNEVLRRRFLKEAQITGQLEHPGIVPVFELSHWDDERQPFYTMRFIKGRTLTEAGKTYHEKHAKNEAEPLDFVALLNAFVTVCNTIAYAHSRGIIHRDLKGQNVVVGDFGEVVVLDWGLAKVVDGSDSESTGESGDPFSEGHIPLGLTIQGQTLGTPAYMAPEQAAGRLDEIDTRTDVYGLGAMLYEILTGKAPFSGADTREVLKNVCEKEPTSPRSLVADVPATLEAVCLHALAKKPADRYASAAELAQEVQQWQEVQRKRAEDALRASEQRFRTMAEKMPAMTAIFQGTGHAYANPAAIELIGYSLEELRHMSFLDYVHPDFRPLALERSQARNQGDPEKSRYEMRLMTKTGAEIWVDFAGAVIEYEGKPAALGIAVDITQRKQAEEALRASEHRFRMMAEKIPTLFAIFQGTGHAYVNPTAEAILGYSVEELRNMNFVDYVHPDFRGLVLERFQARMRGEAVPSRYEIPLVTKAGANMWVDFTGVPIEYEGKPANLGIAVDITQRKQAEEALRASERRFRTMVEVTPTMVAIIQGTGHLYLNPAAAAMLGYSKEELLQLSFLDYVHPDFRQLASERFQARMRGEPVPSRYEIRLVTKDATDVWVDFAGASIEYEGKPAILALGIDITTRKRMEEALRSSEQLYHSLLDMLPLNVWRKDADGRVTYANKALCASSKRPLSEIVGRTDLDLYPAALAAKYRRDDEWVQSTGRTFEAIEQHVTGDGVKLDVKVVKIPIWDATGKTVGTQGIFWDVSDRQRLEEKLKQALAEVNHLRAQLQ